MDKDQNILFVIFDSLRCWKEEEKIHTILKEG